ncbi:hypothetical protein Ciccas_013043 [Cichlidogyrus casuarinus]|uniref:Uncharacterized protein n=1 Tax=Cichlidogyrus casuarinus TaxID=1844966 RepID=A0ABD2PP16_9PLAT
MYRLLLREPGRVPVARRFNVAKKQNAERKLRECKMKPSRSPSLCSPRSDSEFSHPLTPRVQSLAMSQSVSSKNSSISNTEDEFELLHILQMPMHSGKKGNCSSLPRETYGVDGSICRRKLSTRTLQRETTKPPDSGIDGSSESVQSLSPNHFNTASSKIGTLDQSKVFSQPPFLRGTSLNFSKVQPAQCPQRKKFHSFQKHSANDILFLDEYREKTLRRNASPDSLILCKNFESEA